jgi:hypothetical protein
MALLELMPSKRSSFWCKSLFQGSAGEVDIDIESGRSSPLGTSQSDRVKDAWELENKENLGKEGRGMAGGAVPAISDLFCSTRLHQMPAKHSAPSSCSTAKVDMGIVGRVK